MGLEPGNADIVLLHQRLGLSGTVSRNEALKSCASLVSTGRGLGSDAKPCPPGISAGARGCRQAAGHFRAQRHHAALSLPARQLIERPAGTTVVTYA